ncbi:MAG: very short patch repair endonuclease [Alphaproteobacteria bacterium]|nr:very short patch repair endonuclease [Alphaproteobacteria bacterium]
MADIVSKAKRSEIMSKIRSRGNKRTELAMVNLLRANKITGWRRHYPIFGKPDFAFPKQKVAIFVDGCFWHGCPKCYRQPRTSRSYWRQKIATNKARDRAVNRVLMKSHWRILRVWEHTMCHCAKRNSLPRKLVGLLLSA